MAEHELIGVPSPLVWVAVKATLLFLTAVAAFRISERRTLAEMGSYDFVAAVACGAIIGRVPNSTTTSYAQGAVTLIAILVVHGVITRARFLPRFSVVVDHAPRLLIRHGEILEPALRASGLTREDVYALLRTHGVTALDEVRFLIFESRGSISVIREEEGAPSGSPVLAIAHAGAGAASATAGKLPRRP